MKKTILLSAFLVLNALTLFGQWVEKSAWPTTGLIRLNVVNDSTLFATGDDLGAYILKSTNSGVDWDTISFHNAWLFEIQFLNDSIGFVGGQADFITGPTYFKTLDGGQSWQPMNFATGGGMYLHSLFFLSKDTGFASSGWGLYKTTNGGDSFQRLQLPDTPSFLSAVYFKNNEAGFVTGWLHLSNETYRYLVFKTTNQGDSWTKVYSEILTNEAYFGFDEIYFSNQQNGFISGFKGCYLQSADGGDTWEKISVGGNKIMSHFDFVTTNTGYAVRDTMLLKTTDGGLTWQESPTPAGTDVMDVQFLNDQIGYISGHKVCKTTTGTGTGIASPTGKKHIKIAPNPAKDLIHLQYSNLHIQSLKLTDLSGRIVKTFPAESKTLNVSGVAAGLYFLQVKAKEGTVAKKVEIR